MAYSRAKVGIAPHAGLTDKLFSFAAFAHLEVFNGTCHKIVGACYTVYINAYQCIIYELHLIIRGLYIFVNLQL